MNILNLLIKEKQVAGIEIGNQVVRIAYFRKRERHSDAGKLPEKELVLIEEPISANIISGGAVLDKVLLGKTLRDIWAKEKIRANFAIVAIPEDAVYSKVFPFPKNIDESHLAEAVNLAINFQLPAKKSEIYADWEKVLDTHPVNEVLITSIPRTIADGYVEALNIAGIKILALESHLASIARSINLEPDTATLFTKKNSDGGATVFILKDGSLRFSRTLPASFNNAPDSLTNEAARVKSAFESDRKLSVVVHQFNEASFGTPYLKYPELSNYTPELQIKWLVAAGAAMRGEIPEGKDTHISLLSVGMAEAYAYQKATTFVALIRNMIIGVSVFFAFSFLAMYFFVFYLSQSANSAGLVTPRVSSDLLQKEARINTINSATAASQVILSTTPIWNILLDDISAHVIRGILISNFSAASVGDTMTMTGTAQDRNTLNEFKKSLQTSTYLTAVELPISNIEQKADIPFTISFRLKDPGLVYNK